MAKKTEEDLYDEQCQKLMDLVYEGISRAVRRFENRYKRVGVLQGLDTVFVDESLQDIIHEELYDECEED